jgi:hypothetical protein
MLSKRASLIQRMNRFSQNNKRTKEDDHNDSTDQSDETQTFGFGTNRCILKIRRRVEYFTPTIIVAIARFAALVTLSTYGK